MRAAVPASRLQFETKYCSSSGVLQAEHVVHVAAKLDEPVARRCEHVRGRCWSALMMLSLMLTASRQRCSTDPGARRDRCALDREEPPRGRSRPCATGRRGTFRNEMRASRHEGIEGRGAGPRAPSTRAASSWAAPGTSRRARVACSRALGGEPARSHFEDELVGDFRLERREGRGEATTWRSPDRRPPS